TTALLTVWNEAGGADIALADRVADINYQAYVDDGDKAMKFNYAGDSSTAMNISADWNKDGIEALRLRFRPAQDNIKSNKLYVTIGDGTNSTTLDYPEDLNDMTMPVLGNGWQTWNIDLTVISGVDLNNVQLFKIGVGNGSAGGVTGNLYFDEIRLYVPRCIGGYADDITGNCIADNFDIASLVSWYGRADQTITASAPTAAPLIKYEFEDDEFGTNVTNLGSYVDGNGTVLGTVLWGDDTPPTGHGSQCLITTESPVSIPLASVGTMTSEYTVTVWAYGEWTAAAPDYQFILYSESMNTASNALVVLGVPIGVDGTTLGVYSGGDLTYQEGHHFTAWTPQDDLDVWGQWNHYAATKDS
ncbi:MAG: hypothetical protein AB1599_11180, partial [Planctomycetota bacterium]